MTVKVMGSAFLWTCRPFSFQAAGGSVVISVLQEISVHVARAMHNVGDVQMAAGRIFIGVAQKNDMLP
jgi:hypothetical protein